MDSSRASTKAADTEPDWEDAFRRIASGEQTALKGLYDGTSSQLFGLVLRILQDRFAAEEVLLDVYTQVWRRAADYDPRQGAPFAWLVRIARTRAIDRLRSTRTEQPASEALDSPAPDRSRRGSDDEQTAVHRRQEIVRSALASLAPEQQEALELAYYSALSHSEIAARLDQPLEAVKSRIRSGMMKLYEMLQPQEETR